MTRRPSPATTLEMPTGFVLEKIIPGQGGKTREFSFAKPIRITTKNPWLLDLIAKR